MLPFPYLTQSYETFCNTHFAGNRTCSMKGLGTCMGLVNLPTLLVLESGNQVRS